jgi:hypothetical protein
MASAEYMEKYRAEHPELVKESVRTWKARNPDKVKSSRRATYLRATFGLEPKQVDDLIKQQGGVCAICGNAETLIGNGGEIRELCVDHCHATGVIRGVLCSACNGLLGYCRDNVNTLQAAITYLKVANTGLKMPVVPSAEDLLDEISKL